MLKSIEKGLFSKSFIIILLLAFFLRLYDVAKTPPSLNWDEVSLGYNAYSVLKTGKDEWGKVFPLIFQAYGDYKLPGYVYILTPFVSLFGLNEFSVRFPSVIAGTLTVLFTYLIVKELLKNNSSSKSTENISLLAAFLVAIEPWSLFLSRPAFEANLGLCFFVIALYLFLRSLSTLKCLPYSVLFFGLTVWSYNSYRIFTPIFMLLMFFIYRKDLKKVIKSKSFFVTSAILMAVLFLPMFLQLITGVGQQRYRKVEIIDAGAIGQIVNLRNKYNLNPLAERLLFNRPTYFLYNFSKNIISHFSYKYLFNEGGTNYQFSVPNFRLLYKVDLIFLIIGMFYLLKLKNRASVVLLLWLLVGAVPSALTHEAPHVLRSITMLPAFMIIIAVGVCSFCDWLLSKKLGIILKFFVFLYLLILMQSLLVYLKNYFVDYRINYSWSWQYGYKEVVKYTKVNYQKYDKIIITKKYGEPHEFVLFYTPWDPNKYQNDANLIRFKQSDWFWVDRFDKFYFVNDWDIPKEEWQPFVLESKQEEVDCQGVRCLLITSPGNVPKGWSKLDTINFLNGSEAFEIYDNS